LYNVVINASRFEPGGALPPEVFCKHVTLLDGKWASDILGTKENLSIYVGAKRVFSDELVLCPGNTFT